MKTKEAQSGEKVVLRLTDSVTKILDELADLWPECYGRAAIVRRCIAESARSLGVKREKPLPAVLASPPPSSDPITLTTPAPTARLSYLRPVPKIATNPPRQGISATVSSEPTGDGRGHLSGKKEVVIDENGEATFKHLTIDQPGEYVLIVTVPGYPEARSEPFQIT